ATDRDACTRAFGISFGTRDQEHEPSLGPGDVGDIHAYQLRTAQGTCEANEEKGAVTSAGKRRPAHADQLSHVGNGEGGGTARWGPVLAPDAAKGFADGRGLGVERMASDAAGAGNGCDPAAESRQCVAFTGSG